MNKQYIRYLRFLLIGLDLLLLNLSVFLVSYIFKADLLRVNFQLYTSYLFIANIAWILVSILFRTYSARKILDFEHFLKITLQSYGAWLVVILLNLVVFQQKDISRLILIAAIMGFGAGLLINRFLYLGIRKYNKRRESFLNRILIIGHNDTAKKLASYFEGDGMNNNVVGFIVDDYKSVNQLSTYPLYEGIENSVKFASQMQVQEIYSTISPEENKAIYSLLKEADDQCIRFKLVPNLSLFVNRNVHIDYFNNLPILSMRSIALDDVGNKIKKRALDVIVGFFVTILVLSWLVPLLALLIKMESRGPVFFPQKRTGLNGKEFFCLKFRSMRVNKESDTKQATKNDDRVTKIGWFMRKTSLDEFPQFWNVLRGEMSLVGPRPHMLKHTDDYSKIVDSYMVRQFLKPGITGWAQINGFRGEITNPEQIQLRVNKDLWYLEHWTLWLDIKILFLTVYTIVKGDKNAY